jgi:hypothetical protein
LTGCAAAAARRPCVEPLLRLRLERAYNQRDGGVTENKSDRLMRELVGDPASST